MDNRTFYTGFASITALSATAISATGFQSELSKHMPIAWAYLLFFSVFVWVSFMLAKKAAISDNKNDYTKLVITLIFLKLLFCISIVIGYDKIVQPTDNFHVIYFLVLYIIYSIFEFRFLHKLGYKK